MKNSPVSFGKKIPLYNCQVLNKQTGKYVPATFYEYDCKDREDSVEIKNLEKKLVFRNHIAKNMENRYEDQLKGSKKTYPSVYTIMAENSTIGLAQVDDTKSKNNLDFISTSQDGSYKYAGQTMVACIGKQSLKKNKNKLTVEIPTYQAVPFYEKLGFTREGESLLKIGKNGILNLIKKTEQTTQSPILDIEA